MHQILQSLGSGETELVEVPLPALKAHSIVVETRASVISAGTERTLVEFGRGNLLGKARQQPEKVKQVLDKVRTDGLSPTLNAVRAKLDRPIPLGYCQAGVVREVGAGVVGLQEGDRVVTNGPHAEYVRVPWTLAARVPDGVSFESAAFTPLAAIGLQGFRLGQLTLGETVVVYGLGLIGLLTVQIARAGGCRVIGIDRMPERLELARGFGAETVEAAPNTDLPSAVRALTDGVGADAVLLTLATDSDEPVHLAAEMTRKRGRLVLVGVSGLNLRRADFYEKELSLHVSCSYGPGRYDPNHEEGGQDYPLPYVRWTEGRNFTAVLDLMAGGRLDPSRLITHRFPFQEARQGYSLLTSSKGSLGIVLDYPERSGTTSPEARLVMLPEASRSFEGRGVVGVIGAGNFASRMLIPAFASAGADLHTIVSSGGTSGAVVGKANGFRRTATDLQAVLGDEEIDTVVIATRHNSHADLAVQALESGKHVFVEKPLALTEAEVDRVAQAHEQSGRVLTVGFNRRFAPLTGNATALLASRIGPLALDLTVNAGSLPDDHWTRDPAIGGGRLVGEACHFIDLARHLTGSPISNVAVTTAMMPSGDPIEDIALLQLSFADGSMASVRYLSNGSSAFPKERVEGFWDGKSFRIDNFRRIHGWGVSGLPKRLWARQDKGHSSLVAAFMEAVRGHAEAPIPMDQLVEVSRWSANIAVLARERGRG